MYFLNSLVCSSNHERKKEKNQKKNWMVLVCGKADSLALGKSCNIYRTVTWFPQSDSVSAAPPVRGSADCKMCAEHLFGKAITARNKSGKKKQKTQLSTQFGCFVLLSCSTFVDGCSKQDQFALLPCVVIWRHMTTYLGHFDVWRSSLISNDKRMCLANTAWPWAISSVTLRHCFC